MQPGKTKLGLVTLVAVVVTLLAASYGVAAPTTQEQLGKLMYFDKHLSHPDGQSCADCHHPSAGFTDPDAGLPVSEGVVDGLFGGRNSPISAYAMYWPFFGSDADGYLGGLFWDGRATGQVLGDPLADQALGPPLAAVEMANPDKQTVVADILGSPYAADFVEICGETDLADPAQVEAAYDCMAESIGIFERTQLFGRFNSRYDTYLRDCLNRGGTPGDCAQGSGAAASAAAGAVLTAQEWDGLRLFMGANNNDGTLTPGEGAGCSTCHAAQWTAPADYQLDVHVPTWSGGAIPPLFTNLHYANLGIPKSDHPLLVDNPVDYGLGGVLNDPAENGKFRIMTLRVIGQSAPYLHNGYLDTIEEVVHFINTRDVAGLWPPPEVPENVNYDNVGNLGLGAEEEAALVAFLETLMDGEGGRK